MRFFNIFPVAPIGSASTFYARLFDHHQQGPLIPFGMSDADAGRLLHSRMRHGDVFQVDGAYPFAAGNSFV